MGKLIAGGRGLAFASLSLMICVSCDLVNSEGGPGSGPGVPGSISPTPAIATLLRASAKGIQPEPNGSSDNPDVSADGRFVVFYSYANNLVAGDTNFTSDVFVRDRDFDEDGIFDEDGGVATVRVSVNSLGEQATSDSYYGTISADGRFVAFLSYADNLDLVTPDTNFTGDAFWHDRDTDADGIFDEPGFISTVRVSINDAGVEGNEFVAYVDISADGQHVTFVSYANNLDSVLADNNGTYDIFVRDINAGTTVRVSLNHAGGESNDFSYLPYISGNGRFVCFYSYAALAADDFNFDQDVYVHDRDADGDLIFDEPGETAIIRASVATDGTEANAYCSIQGQCISFDGRYVVFWSSASSLAPGNPSQIQQIFLRNRDVSNDGVFDEPGDVSTTIVSLSSNGSMANDYCYFPSISDDGQRMAFMSLANNLVLGDNNFTYDVYVRDLPSGTTTRVSVSLAGGDANSYSYPLNLSPDGNTVVFRSQASNLVAVDVNGTGDCFARNLTTNLTARVSQGASTEPGADSIKAAISGDGNFIAFESNSTDIVAGDTNNAPDVFLRDVNSGANVRISISSTGLQGNGSSQNPAISQDGRFVAFQTTAENMDGVLVGGDDPDALSDIYVRSLSSTVLVSRGNGLGAKGNGASANPSISATGRYIAFQSVSSNLPGDADGTSDIFVRDTFLNTTVLVSRSTGGAKGNAASINPAISADGQFVAFQSVATNLVAPATAIGRSHVYVRSIAAGTTVLVSGGFGAEANADSSNPTISANGQLVAFQSLATNLVSPNTALAGSHVYLRDTGAALTTLVSVGILGEANDSSGNPAISDDGSFIAYDSMATNLVLGDLNAVSDVFRYEVAGTVTVRISRNTSGTDSGPLVTGPSQLPAITLDGSFVAFQSTAKDLVSPQELGSFSDIYRAQ